MYDDDGNMTQGYTPDGYLMTMTYDAENRMKTAEFTDSSSVIHKTEYYYSGDGFLAKQKKFDNGILISETNFERAGFLPVHERDGSNNVVREYTWGLDLGGGIGGLLNLKQGGINYSYLYDGKGNVNALIDSNQQIVASYRYDAFGMPLKKVATLDQPYRFSTKQCDEQFGHYYFGYRFYNPITGRWMTRDPLGEAGGTNLYQMVGNNPVNWIDPWGLDETSWYGDGRSLFDGPKNGNWCGGNWCGGQNPKEHEGRMGEKPPMDSLDEACNEHDLCYSDKNKTEKECDKNLVDNLKKLPDDPNKWPKPPRKGTEDDSSDYRDDAIWLFK